MKSEIPYRLKHASGGVAAGTIVYRLGCHDYGLANDDTRMTGIQHVSVTLKPDGDYPGFTVPEDLLEECT